MTKRLLGLLAAAAILFAACDSGAPPATAGSPAATGSAPAGSVAVPSARATPRPTRPAPSASPGRTASSPSAGATASGVDASGGPTSQPSGGAEPSASAGPPAPDLTGTSYSYEPPPSGTRRGTLIVGILAFPTTINPYAASSTADLQTFRAASFNGLVTVTNDLRYVPDLATAVPLLSNGGVVLRGTAMDVTWELKPGMRWSDGQPISCADLEATWRWNVDPANAGFGAATAGWRDVASIEATSETTCVMHFARVFEGYLGLVSTLLPAHYLRTVAGGLGQTGPYPLFRAVSGVYSGPYVPIEVVDQTRVTFVANPKWATIGGHQPFLERIVFRLFPDADALVAAYRSGEVQLAMDLGEDDTGRLGAIPLNQVRRIAAMTYAGLDFNSATLDAKLGGEWQAVVRAIRLAIDRDALVAGPLGGTVRPTETFVSPLAWFARAERAPSVPDPAAAGQVLDGAGWRSTADGGRSRNGATLALDLCTTQAPADVAAAAAIAGQLAAVGIATTVVSRPAQPDVEGGWDSVPEGTACNAARGTYEVLLRDHRSTVDPLGGYDVYVSDRTPDAPPHDGRNVSRATLPALDEAYAVVRDAVDLAVIQNAMDVIQDTFASDQNTFELPLYTRTLIWLAGMDLHNITPNPSPATSSWNIGDWWIQPPG